MACSLSGTTNDKIAVLDIIKSMVIPIDLSTVSFASTKLISFLSQSVGWIADVDLGTEPLRFLGNARFAVGYLVNCVLKFTKFPCDIALLVTQESKSKIRQDYNTNLPSLKTSSLELKYGNVNDSLQDDWKIINCDNMRSIWAGNMPWMSRDGLFFPAAKNNDGQAGFYHNQE